MLSSLKKPRDLEIYSTRVKPHQSDLTLAIPPMNILTNSSAIIRSAGNFGVKKVYLIGKHKISHSCSCGTDKYVDYEFLDSYSDLVKRANFHPIIVADCHGDILLTEFEFPENPILVMGCEGGLEKKIRESADYRIKIPLYGISDSFNVGVAAGIFLYEHRRQYDRRMEV